MSPQLSGHLANRITPLVIARAALDAGGRVSDDKSAWLEAVESLPWRRDLRGPLLSVAKVLALNADPQMLAAPGVENLERHCGIGERRVYRILRRLRDEGLLGWVSTGSTCLRSGNWRATYVLTIPPGIELPPDPDEVSGRPGSPGEESPRAREASFWRDSPSLKWARRHVAGWSDRQFETAITYPPELDRPYGPPTGRSMWRILAWRLSRFTAPDGTFAGPLALIAQQPPRGDFAAGRRADRAQWAAEMAERGALEILEFAKAECVRIVREATQARLRDLRVAGR